MGPNLSELLLAGLPLIVAVAVIWVLSAALRPRNTGVSEAERYQRELAVRSAAHQAAQAQAALALRARVDAATQPSQNEAQHAQHAQQERQGRPALPVRDAGQAQPGMVLPDGQLSPQLVLQLQAMVRSGQKIQAVKLLRQVTHSDLLAAKNYIDRL